MRPIGLAALLFLIFTASACGGGDDHREAAPEGSARGPSGVRTSGGGSFVVGGADLAAAGGSGASLQGPGNGITVVGYGEASAAPTGATIRLVISAGDPVFGSDSFSIEFIEAEELEPAVDAIKAEGVDEDDISVDTFAQSQFGYGQAAAEVTFQWPRTDGISELAGEIQDVVRRETDYTLASFQVLFTVEDCEALETRSQEAALEDARHKAERLGKLADLGVGPITGVTEGGGPASIYGILSGCASLEQLPADFLSSNPHNSASEVVIDATLSVTFTTE